MIVNTEHGVAWSVPHGWWELSERAVRPSTQTLYSRTWSDEKEGAAIFSESPPNFPDGLMVLSIEVEPESASPLPSGSIPSAIYWGGYDMQVYAFEASGVHAAPFALRQGIVVLRSPYRYNLTLGCLPPQDGDIAEYDFLCRYTWTNVSYPFGICPLPLPSSDTSAGTWQVIDNLDYDYSFEVPADLLEVRDDPRLHWFLNDPAALRPPAECPLLNGLMFLNFAADPLSEFSLDALSNVEAYTETRIGGLPAWVQTKQGVEGLRPLDTYTELYIQGPEFWYTMRWTCKTPTDDSEEDQAEFAQQCQAVLERILDSFQVISPSTQNGSGLLIKRTVEGSSALVTLPKRTTVS
jgi:hypothetical protein